MKDNKTKQEMINKACQIIRSEGVEHFTIQQLLNKLEISVGTFYYYFTSKEELLFQTLVYMDEQFVEKFEKKYKDVTSNVEKLRLFLYEQSLVASNFTTQYLDNYRNVIKSQIMTYYFNSKVSPKYQMLINIIEKGQENKEFTDQFTSKAMAELVWTTMAGLADFSRISELYDITDHTDKMGKMLSELFRCN